MSDDILRYWNERAEQDANTTDDPHLRELEYITLTAELRKIDTPGRVLDVGCGDGCTTTRLAKAFDGFAFHGIDFAANMIAKAVSRPSPATFDVGDVTKLDELALYDIVISDRCLINLATVQQQSTAIEQIAAHVTPGGYFIAIENFIETHNNMNRARKSVGLPAIPVRWHNLYFREAWFLREVEHYFTDVVFTDFASSYYFATRVVEPAITGDCGQVNERAVMLPPFGQLSPVRMAVMVR